MELRISNTFKHKGKTKGQGAFSGRGGGVGGGARKGGEGGRETTQTQDAALPALPGQLPPTTRSHH